MRQCPAMARRTEAGNASTGSLLTSPTRASGTWATASTNRVVASIAYGATNTTFAIPAGPYRSRSRACVLSFRSAGSGPMQARGQIRNGVRQRSPFEPEEPAASVPESVDTGPGGGSGCNGGGAADRRPVREEVELFEAGSEGRDGEGRCHRVA